MVKLKIPIYTPIFSAGKAPDSNEYGIAKIAAQAIPIPIIDINKALGVLKKYIER